MLASSNDFLHGRLANKLTQTYSGPCIALVDDDSDIHDLMERIVDRIPGASLVSAIDSWHVPQLARSRPALFLVDVHLKQSINGLEIARTLRRLGDGKAKIYLFSAQSQEELDQLAISCNADGAISKNQSSNEICAAIKAAISRPKV